MPTKRLEVPSFADARVLIVGDVMLDRYWHGATARVSPEAPVPVVRVSECEDRPGGAANVALNVAALAGASALVGITGADEAAKTLRQRLNAAGVSTSFHQVSGQPTITKLRVISRHQQLLRMDFEESFESVPAEQFQALVGRALEGCHVLVLSDYRKGALRNPQAIIRAARARRVPVLVDPKGEDFERYRGATLLTPNLAEFEAVVGVSGSEEEMVRRAQHLIGSLGLEALLVTRGENGMTLIREGHSELHLPARAREVYDVTGAGDTVVSVLAASMAAGCSLDDAVALANLGAGLVVGKLGTAVVSAPELRRALYQQGGADRGVMTDEQLLLAIEDARSHGERIVFTNGCFDIIHAGHVGYLASARRLGERLVVAVNSDDSIRRLKGVGRPVNALDRRMAVLAALENVDWVVPFYSDTPEPLLEKVRPEVLVKGGDYSVEQVVGADLVHAYGGRVEVLDFFDGSSTSVIVDKIGEIKPES